MSVTEFQGIDENEALENASAALGISIDKLRYEVVESKKKGIFSKGNVKINVYVDEESNSSFNKDKKDVEEKIITYLEELLSKMALPGKVTVSFREENRLGLNIKSDDSSIIIGKKGKTLDALQLIMNIVANNMFEDGLKVIVDIEGYRNRRQQMIVYFAQRVADQVRRTRRSRLLEPMNPFERRLIHTALNDLDDIETESEGAGLYKQVRVSFKSRNR